MTLNDSFSINVKLLSVDHQNERVQKGKLVLHRPGFLAHPVRKNQRWLFFVPNGFGHANKYAFKNKCLMVALILGYTRKKSFISAEAMTLWECMSQLHSADLHKQKLAGCAILREYINWTKIFIMNRVGPFPLKSTCNMFQKIFKMQVNVFSERRDYKMTFSSGSKYDPSLPQIYLLLEEEEHSSHVNLILKIKTFQGIYKKTCLGCKTRIGPYFNHNCRNDVCRLCQICQRKKLRKYFYTDEENIKEYCSAAIQPDISEKCPVCDLPFTQKNCKEVHMEKICHKGFYCQKCKSYEKKTLDHKSIEDLIETHTCGKALCKSCYKVVPNLPDHLCKLSPVKQQTFFSNIAFFSFTSEEENAEDEIISQRPMLCTVIYEDIERGSFKVKFIGETNLNLPETQSRHITFEYLPKFVKKEDRKIARNHRPVHFGNSMSRTKIGLLDQKIKKGNDAILTEKVIKYFIQEKFRSYTFMGLQSSDLVILILVIDRTFHQLFILFSESHFVNTS